MINIGIGFYVIRFDIDNVEEKTATFASHSSQTKRFFFQNMKFYPKNNTREFLFKLRKFFIGNFFLGNMSDGIFCKKMNFVIATTEYNGNLKNSTTIN